MKTVQPRPQKKNPILRFVAGFLAHWQILASAGLLTAGVVGLKETYPVYCGMTDLTYAPAEIRADLEEGAQISGFPAGVLAAQLETESHWHVNVSSSAGAHGIAQFTDATWAEWGNGGDINNAHDSIDAQARFLKYLQERLKPYIKTEADRIPITMAGYNAGPGAVEEYGGVPPYFETQNYVRKITQLADTKYKVTCEPDPNYKHAVITYAK